MQINPLITEQQNDVFNEPRLFYMTLRRYHLRTNMIAISYHWSLDLL